MAYGTCRALRQNARNQVLVLSAQWGLPMGQRGRPLQHWHSGTSSSAISDQLRDHTGKKRKYWLVLTEVMRAAPRVFVCVRWHGTCKQHLRSPLEKLRAAKLVVLLSAQRSAPATCHLRAASGSWELGVGERKWVWVTRQDPMATPGNFGGGSTGPDQIFWVYLSISTPRAPPSAPRGEGRAPRAPRGETRSPRPHAPPAPARLLGFGFREPTPGGPGPGLRPDRKRLPCQLPLWPCITAQAAGASEGTEGTCRRPGHMPPPRAFDICPHISATSGARKGEEKH
jgi:hypothetical protein